MQEREVQPFVEEVTDAELSLDGLGVFALFLKFTDFVIKLLFVCLISLVNGLLSVAEHFFHLDLGIELGHFQSTLQLALSTPQLFSTL